MGDPTSDRRGPCNRSIQKKNTSLGAAKPPLQGRRHATRAARTTNFIRAATTSRSGAEDCGARFTADGFGAAVSAGHALLRQGVGEISLAKLSYPALPRSKL